ncbi:MAG TPA: Uma2 family endonuclease [Verrucomicrobiae bacterium]|nr:Uma2 family endonuclease [Verrucomicrobiae bacterium]
MPVQTQHRFSVKEYYRMADTGLLRPDARVELLDGKIIDRSPIGPFHGGIASRLTRLFNQLSNDRWLVSPQNALHLDEFSELQPDLALLKPVTDDYTSAHPRAEDVFLLIEVSDSTPEYDRSEKLPAYGRAGIPEVWIVNLVALAIEVYREPHFAGYENKTIVRAGAIAPAAFPDAALDVAELLRR